MQQKIVMYIFAKDYRIDFVICRVTVLTHVIAESISYGFFE